jgi:hypothetical protein
VVSVSWWVDELLYQRGRPPRSRYLFKHALIQDAAYQSLLKRTRQQYHQQVKAAGRPIPRAGEHATGIGGASSDSASCTVGGMTVPAARHDFAGVVSSRLSPTSRVRPINQLPRLSVCVEEIFL